MAESLAARPVQPLSTVAALAAPHMGRELVALFAHVERMPDKVQWVCRHVGAELAPVNPVLDRACGAVAVAIDAQAHVIDSLPYHNRQHFCEVALTGYVLGLLNRLDGAAIQFVLLAALVHDFVHDGGTHDAFRQERASVERARPLLRGAGMDEARIERLTALVLATDTIHGSRFMAAACKGHARRVSIAPAPPPGAPELALLVADAELATLAAVLCEADILPSIGLSVEHAMCLQERLSREWGRPLGQRDKISFIDAVLRQGIVGDFFLPNVHATRRALASTADAPRPD